jgi:hypothetical protein
MLGTLLQWVGSTTVTSVLNQLDDLGFFSYVLPFLLIFALVYAILIRQKLFEENRGAALIISLAIGLLALQLDIVSIFFAKIFPTLGKGLAVLIVALILMGAFIPEGTKNPWALSLFLIIGGVIFLVVVINSFRDTGLGVYTDFESFWNNYGAILIILAILITATIIVGRSGIKKDK